MEKLFDICSCIYPDISCQTAKCKLKTCDGVHLDCRCDIKVPEKEIMFLLDKRMARKIKIEWVTESWAAFEESECI